MKKIVLTGGGLPLVTHSYDVNGDKLDAPRASVEMKPSSREQSQPDSSSRRYQPARGSR